MGDASQFKEYYDEQAAWAALPFKDRATKNALSKKIQGKGHSYPGDLGRQDGRNHHARWPRRRVVGTGSLPLEAALGAGHPRAAAPVRRQGGRRSFRTPPSPSSRATKIARRGRLIFNPWAKIG